MALTSLPAFRYRVQYPRQLTPPEINSLTHRPGVQPIVLWRFFQELDLAVGEAEQVEAALFDDRARCWRLETFNAILDGITLAYQTDGWRR